jgi:hypothetical protein
MPRFIMKPGMGIHLARRLAPHPAARRSILFKNPVISALLRRKPKSGSRL